MMKVLLLELLNDTRRESPASTSLVMVVEPPVMLPLMISVAVLIVPYIRYTLKTEAQT